MDNNMDESFNSVLPNWFEHKNWKINDVFPVLIANVYDPSKFWIRFSPVDVLQKHLWEFYNEKNPTPLTLSEITTGLNCVVLISNLYYRGRIVKTAVEDTQSFVAFLYDFGMLSKVEITQIYPLHESFHNIPTFAVRAALAKISSLDHEMWNQESTDRFFKLVDDKPLIAKIVHIHWKTKILDINLFDVSNSNDGTTCSINHRLVSEGMAKIAWHHPIADQDRKNDQFKSLRDCLYKYPTFEMIENGYVPSSVYLTETLKQCIPWDLIFPQCYQFQDQN